MNREDMIDILTAPWLAELQGTPSYSERQKMPYTYEDKAIEQLAEHLLQNRGGKCLEKAMTEEDGDLVAPLVSLGLGLVTCSREQMLDLVLQWQDKCSEWAHGQINQDHVVELARELEDADREDFGPLREAA